MFTNKLTDETLKAKIRYVDNRKERMSKPEMRKECAKMHGTRSVADAIANADTQCEWTLRGQTEVTKELGEK